MSRNNSLSDTKAEAILSENELVDTILLELMKTKFRKRKNKVLKNEELCMLMSILLPGSSCDVVTACDTLHKAHPDVFQSVGNCCKVTDPGTMR